MSTQRGTERLESVAHFAMDGYDCDFNVLVVSEQGVTPRAMVDIAKVRHVPVPDALPRPSKADYAVDSGDLVEQMNADQAFHFDMDLWLQDWCEVVPTPERDQLKGVFTPFEAYYVVYLWMALGYRIPLGCLNHLWHLAEEFEQEAGPSEESALRDVMEVQSLWSVSSRVREITEAAAREVEES